MKQLFENVFEEDKKIFTFHNDEMNIWDPYHSKASAAIKKGLKTFPIKEGTKILYLGIAEGNTASHFSDIIGEKGVILGIDISNDPFRKLLELCKERKNIIPVLSDANQTDNYKEYAEEIGKFDVVYQDLAQKTQADILIKNVELFLKSGGIAIYMVKAFSIDTTARPDAIFKQEVEKLEKAGLEIIEIVKLEPFEIGHACIVAKKK